MKKTTNSGRFKKGNTPWNKGLKGSVKPNSGTITKGMYANERHPQWKGNNASYQAIHQWMSRHFGKPSRCEMCGTMEAKKFEWANLDGKYTRNRDDWMRLCSKCHHKLDDISARGWATRKGML